MPEPHWNGLSEFVITCIAMSVGLGNIWKFPFIAYENGGGTFLVAYIVVVCILAIPLYFFEVAIGQFSGKGSLKLFSSLAPAFTGIGALQTFISILAASYYCPLLAITLYYFVKSFNSPLPWTECYSEYQDICVGSMNTTQKVNMTSSSELFFTKYLFQEFSSLDHGMWMIDGRLAFAMLATWSGIFFVSTNAVKTAGNYHYYFGLCPYFILFTMLGIALGQKGSAKGLRYLFSAEWSNLLDAKVWYNAISQCFYSLGFGFGIIPLLASYNSFNSEICTVSMVVPLIDTCVSLLCGMTTFAVLGNMADRLNTEVEEVIRSRSIGILFITYPEALGMLTAAPCVMAIICFAMIYALGFGSLVAIQQVTNRQIMDYTNLEYSYAAALSSVLGFLLGLIYITREGIYIVQLVDYFGVAMLTYFVVFFEVLSVIYGYGLRNFCWDIEYMTTRHVHIWFRVVWSLITPISLIVIFSCYLATLCKGMKIDGAEFPTIALICGWLLFLLGIALMPGCAVYHLCKRREEGCPNMFWSIFNHDKWAPASETDSSEWKASRRPEERGNNAFVDFLKAIIRR